LFENQRSLSQDGFRQFAESVGLDMNRFNDCLDSRKYQGDVEADYHAGEKIGVNATPAFFINGRYLSGAQPFEAFQKIIDDELGN
jgi:predicted DsbA family dithiol-disulfide isomerase